MKTREAIKAFFYSPISCMPKTRLNCLCGEKLECISNSDRSAELRCKDCGRELHVQWKVTKPGNNTFAPLLNDLRAEGKGGFK